MWSVSLIKGVREVISRPAIDIGTEIYTDTYGRFTAANSNSRKQPIGRVAEINGDYAVILLGDVNYNIPIESLDSEE